MTGVTASLAELQLFNANGELVCNLDNDEATLGSFPVADNFRIHVSHSQPVVYSMCGEAIGPGKTANESLPISPIY